MKKVSEIQLQENRKEIKSQGSVKDWIFRFLGTEPLRILKL